MDERLSVSSGDSTSGLSVPSVSSGDSTSGLSVPSGSRGESASGPTVLNVGSLVVQGSGTGLHQGNLVNVTVNHYIVPKCSDMDRDAVNELVTDAITDTIRINTDSKKKFFSVGAPDVRDWWGDGLKKLKKYVRKRYRLLTGMLLLTSSVIVVAAVLFSVFVLHSTSSADASVNSTLCIVTRQEWGALNATGPTNNSTLPLIRVIVAHTAEDFCLETTKCITVVQDIQKEHQMKGMSDIAYNFLIGGDGKAYEGRGWLVQGSHTKYYNNQSLGVAFIGTYIDVQPNVTMVKAFLELIRLSKELKYLSNDYDLLAQCQIKNTASPGLALFNSMPLWPHFNLSLPCMIHLVR